MKKQKILLLYSNALFANGVASLLRQKSAEIRMANRRQKGWGPMESLRPDLVVVEGADSMLVAIEALRELLKHKTSGCVIGVNLKAPDAVVLRGARLTATEPNLIQAVNGASGIIENGNFPARGVSLMGNELTGRSRRKGANQ